MKQSGQTDQIQKLHRFAPSAGRGLKLIRLILLKRNKSFAPSAGRGLKLLFLLAVGAGI